MGLLSNPLSHGSFSVNLSLLFLLLAVHCVSAREFVDETEKDELIGSVKDLGRRSKIVLGKLGDSMSNDFDPKSIDFGLSSDSDGLGIFDAFFASLSMIVVSEVLSTGLGRIVPNWISKKHTNSAATASIALKKYLPFPLAGHPIVVEEKLETGQGKMTARRFLSRFCTPIFLESFILTFLAEWGVRSQIATIALATHKNAIGVALGATLGHTICTSLAVVGGSMLAFLWFFLIFLFLSSFVTD